MMKKILQQFKIHPVGQGFFYSGSVQYRMHDYYTRSFLFVFDCGSEQRRNCLEEVDKFKDEAWPVSETLDLLVISHFHSDHINCIRALLDGRRVRRIVAPFVNYADRLVLALIYRNSAMYSPGDPDSDFTLEFILDPVTVLGPFLSEGGEFVFMQSGEVLPFEPFTGSELPQEDSNQEFDFSLRFSGRFRDITASDAKELRCFQTSRIKTARDNSPAFCSLGRTDIMEFLFYRKPVSDNEEAFYHTVYYLFAKRFPRVNTPDKSSADHILQILRERAITRVITDIIRKACQAHPGLNASVSQITNLNTTSLSMLHYNQVSIYDIFPRNHALDNAYCHSSILKKLDGTNRVICEAPLVYDCGYYLYHHQHYYNFPFDPNRKFPNTMLTSDGFLHSEQDIALFYKKFQHYWNKFWLFQLPHHGSKYNADKALLSRLSFDIFLFANFGVKNKHDHPSNELINNVILTRHSDKLLEINEYTGLFFGLQIDSYDL
ncbi:MAG: hypothetical protein WCO02_08800 [Bacteroidota bacterium]